MHTCSSDEKTGALVGGGTGLAAGATVGALAGTAIPIPVLGTAVGGV